MKWWEEKNRSHCLYVHYTKWDAEKQCDVPSNEISISVLTPTGTGGGTFVYYHTKDINMIREISHALCEDFLVAMKKYFNWEYIPPTKKKPTQKIDISLSDLDLDL